MSDATTTLISAAAPFAAWLGASLLYRVAMGKPLFYRRLAGVRFRETSVSGNSNRAWYTKLGGARSCLVVQVTDHELDVHPFVPFNWFFLPEIYDLEFRVPIAQIRSVTFRTNFFAHSLRIEFTNPDAKHKSVSLVLMQAEQFIEALRSNSLFKGTLPAKETSELAGV